MRGGASAMSEKSNRSIQRKVLFMLLAILAISITLITAIMHSVMIRSIDALERNEAKSNIMSVTKTLDAEYSRLLSISHDWATWDDTYEFVVTKDPNIKSAYVSSNLYDGILTNLEVNILIFIDTDNRPVHISAYDLDRSRQAYISTPTLQSILSLKEINSQDPAQKTAGMVMTPDGPLMLAIAPIITSTGDGPVRGHFVIGRFLNEIRLEELSLMHDTSLTLEPIDSLASSTDSTFASPQHKVIGPNSLRTTVSIQDLDGQAILLLSAEEPRSMHHMGVDAIRTVSFALFGISVLMFITISILMNRLVIRRIMKLSKDIRDLGEIGSTSSRLEEDDEHFDELSAITVAVNGMLKKLDVVNNQLHVSEKRYKTLVETGNDVIFMWDDCGRFIYISPNCSKVLGYHSDRLLEYTLDDLLAVEDKEAYSSLEKQYFESSSGDWQLRLITGEGDTRWFRVSVSANFDNEINKYSHIGIISDINNQKNAEIALQSAFDNLETLVLERTNELVRVNAVLQEEQETIKYLAYHDHLTGLPNHLLFKEFLDRSIATSNRTGKPLAVFFVDIDHFKMINDTLGHVAGDQLLVAVAELLSKTLRKTDVIARIGGDEFNIMIDEIDNEDAPFTVATKILRAFDNPLYINGQECFLSSSVGVSIYPVDGDDAVTLIKNADIAMYKAKDNGRNQCVYCTTEMKEQVVENMMLSNQLWRALERNELEVYYQPQVNVATNRIVGSEALIRWHHQELGMISPSKFIPLAEQTGSINAIGEWIMREACHQNRLWQERFDPNLRIAVNLSVKQLHHLRIIDTVRKVLIETGIQPSTVELEITETMAMKEIQYMVDILNQLKALGVDLAIDDFGTEYSSMNYLKELPVDRIKLAMPFVQGISLNERDEAIAKAVIILAKSMGMNIIAEGVETQEQFDFLAQKMCDETQGYYFFRPMPADQMEQVLAEQYAVLDDDTENDALK